MNKFRLLIFTSFLIQCVLIAGCATTYQYQGNNFPPPSSSSFPSFNPVSEITDGIKFKLAEGSWKTRSIINATVSVGQQNYFANVTTDDDCNINIENNLIYGQFLSKTILNGPGKKETSNMKIDAIYETSGKEIKMDVSTDGKLKTLTTEEKKKISNAINNLLAGLGKTVKTGDVLYYLPNEFSNMINVPSYQTIQREKIREVIKGMGVYKNKRVIVTEYSLDDSIHNSERIMEVKGKGYSLYDAEILIPLFGEGVIYLSLFTPKGGTVYTRMDLGIEAYDVQVKNVIDLPSITDRGAAKESAKKSWSEASDKIKALGELLQNGLISKEEYETKKNELLKKF